MASNLVASTVHVQATLLLSSPSSFHIALEQAQKKLPRPCETLTVSLVILPATDVKLPELLRLLRTTVPAEFRVFGDTSKLYRVM